MLYSNEKKSKNGLFDFLIVLIQEKYWLLVFLIIAVLLIYKQEYIKLIEFLVENFNKT